MKEKDKNKLNNLLNDYFDYQETEKLVKKQKERTFNSINKILKENDLEEYSNYSYKAYFKTIFDKTNYDDELVLEYIGNLYKDNKISEELRDKIIIKKEITTIDYDEISNAIYYKLIDNYELSDKCEVTRSKKELKVIALKENMYEE